MKEFKGFVGTHIDTILKQMLEESEPCFTIFNGIRIESTPNSSFEELKEQFHTKLETERIEYEASDEYKEKEIQRQNEINKLIIKKDILMDDLKILDFSDNEAVLDWICAMQEPSDRVGVNVDKDSIIDTFIQNGYYPNMNIGSEFNGKDKENFAKYIVGQGLSTLQTCSIHHMVHKFTNDWKNQFL